MVSCSAIVTLPPCARARAAVVRRNAGTTSRCARRNVTVQAAKGAKKGPAPRKGVSVPSTTESVPPASPVPASPPTAPLAAAALAGPAPPIPQATVRQSAHLQPKCCRDGRRVTSRDSRLSWSLHVRVNRRRRSLLLTVTTCLGRASSQTSHWGSLERARGGCPVF